MYLELSFEEQVERAKVLFDWAIKDMIAECNDELKSPYTYQKNRAKKVLPFLEELEVNDLCEVIYNDKILFTIDYRKGIEDIEEKVLILIRFIEGDKCL